MDRSGVYDDLACDNKTVNHGVVVVGYGALNGTNHWIVRNTWGTNWGIRGYILMQRGVNKCSIETYPAYAVAV
jgi:C1A family cysteine protease